MTDELLNHIENDGIIINDQSELNQLKNMLINHEDWNISRQIPWGFRMPIFYNHCGDYCIADNENEAMLILKTDKITQEESTFDTWFTSSLWPFACLGWPEKTDDLKNIIQHK